MESQAITGSDAITDVQTSALLLDFNINKIWVRDTNVRFHVQFYTAKLGLRSTLSSAFQAQSGQSSLCSEQGLCICSCTNSAKFQNLIFFRKIAAYLEVIENFLQILPLRRRVRQSFMHVKG